MRKSGCARQTRLRNHRNHATQIRSRTIITPACAAAAAAPAHVLHTGNNPSCRKLFTKPAKSINAPQTPTDRLLHQRPGKQRYRRALPTAKSLPGQSREALDLCASNSAVASVAFIAVQGRLASQQVVPSARATIDQNSASAQETFTTKAQTSWLCC